MARIDDARALGLDIEPVSDLSQDVERLVCRAEEKQHFSTLSPCPSGASWRLLAFSAKESVYKAYNPLTASWLDFHDLSLTFSRDTQGDQGTFTAQLVNPDRPNPETVAALEGRWSVVEGKVLTGVFLPP